MLNKAQKDILALVMVPGLGPKSILSLLDVAGGDTEKIFSSTTCNLEKAIGVRFPREAAEDLRNIRASREYQDELIFIEKNGVKAVSCLDENYPEALRSIYDPPPVLFYKGTLAEEDINAVALVGSRRCSAYGLTTAGKLAFDLAKAGVTVVSGMARGIDQGAHRGALKAKGRTIAVLGSGFANVFPDGSDELFASIVENGAVVTEFTSGTLPLKGNFPRRNRIISGLSRGVVVVEASEKSGALITVNYALDQGRDVMAVPGRVDFSVSRGTNMLIQNGAKLVTCVEDIIEELDLVTKRETPVDKDVEEPLLVGMSIKEECVKEALDGKASLHVDEIATFAKIGQTELHEVLLRMEMRKVIKSLPGRNYALA
jgi:DNA processing protein